MKNEELLDGLALIASEQKGLPASLSQVAALLRWLRDNGAPEPALRPLQELAEALLDLHEGHAAPLLKTGRRQTPQRVGPARLRVLLALLVEAHTQVRRSKQEATEHVAAELKKAGVERPVKGKRPHRETTEHYSPKALEHWWAGEAKRASFLERIEDLRAAGRWPSGPGDTLAADALTAEWLALLKAERPEA